VAPTRIATSAIAPEARCSKWEALFGYLKFTSSSVY
jgi:hypothetical protein